NEPYIDTKSISVKVTKNNDIRTVNLQKGWNIVGMAVVSSSLSKASQLVGAIATSGVLPVQVSKYDSGNWINFVVRVNKKGKVTTYGQDFAIIPGEAYFVRVQN